VCLDLLGNPVILFIPLHKPPYALLEGRGGLETDGVHEVVDVGEGFGHVAGLHGEEVLLGLLPEAFLNRGDEFHQAHGAVIADVVEPVRGEARARVRGFPVPAGVGFRDPVHDPNHPLDDVIDVSKVPLHLPVVEDVDVASLQDGLCEREEGHVGPPPGAVDGEEPKARAGDLVKAGIDVGHELVGLLGGGVEAYGVVHVMVDGEGHEGVGPVDGAGGGEDEVLDALVAAALEDIHEARDVTVNVGVGVFEGVTDAGLGGHVQDDVEEVVLEERVHTVAVFDVQFREREFLVLPQDAEPGPLEPDVVVVVQVVDADNGLAVLQEPFGEVKPDEARRPRHKDLSHVNLGVFFKSPDLYENDVPERRVL